MRKQKKGRKLSRKTDQRKALFKALISALLLREKIRTTEAKAREISGLTEKLITKSRQNTLQSRRSLASLLSPQLVKKMVDEIGPRYKDRNGGYTRIMRLGPRMSDGAKMAIIELVK